MVRVPSVDTNLTKLASDNGGEGDCVKVCVRVRPLNDREKSLPNNASRLSVENESHSILVEREPTSRNDPVNSKKYNFDYVADESMSQQELFDQVAKPIAQSCLAGYNASIFAYGQTGAGKTYTIQGESVAGVGVQEKGLMQRCFEEIFSKINGEEKKEDLDGTLSDKT
mmetsp:Transcript_20807/g.32098  ORF Transcript_20807/g.32098 Transcript_20807/m.32098 type:complete len:169 (+) Transcript_20807:321-827(+)